LGDPQIGRAGCTFGLSSYVEARRKERGLGGEQGERRGGGGGGGGSFL